MVLGTVGQGQKLGAMGVSLPHTLGLPSGNSIACPNVPSLPWSMVLIVEEGRFVLGLGFPPSDPGSER